MHNELKTFLNEFPQLSSAEKEEIASILTVTEYRKGTLLLKEGASSDRCFFVLKGCLRQYSLMEGEEQTTAFYEEREAAVLMQEYSAGLPAKSSVVCVENTVVIEGNLGEEMIAYQKFPKLEQITRSMMQQDFAKMQSDFVSFRSATPEERYHLVVQQRPSLLQRVPLHQIASYLGMTPESLSRIRKRSLR